jgi:hypothetical protein
MVGPPWRELILFSEKVVEKRPSVPRLAGFPTPGKWSVVCGSLLFKTQRTKDNRQQTNGETYHLGIFEQPWGKTLSVSDLTQKRITLP